MALSEIKTIQNSMEQAAALGLSDWVEELQDELKLFQALQESEEQFQRGEYITRQEFENWANEKYGRVG